MKMYCSYKNESKRISANYAQIPLDISCWADVSDMVGISSQLAAAGQSAQKGSFTVKAVPLQGQYTFTSDIELHTRYIRYSAKSPPPAKRYIHIYVHV